MFNSESEAQIQLNKHYLASLLDILGGINNSIEGKRIQPYTLLQGKKIKTYYGLVSIGLFDKQGIQLEKQQFICKLTNEEQSLYIIYTSNGLMPNIKDIYIIDNIH